MQSFKSLAEKLCDKFGPVNGKQYFYELINDLQEAISGEVMNFSLGKLTERFVGVACGVRSVEHSVAPYRQWEQVKLIAFRITMQAPELKQHALLKAIASGDKMTIMKLYGELLPHSIESK